MASSSEGSTRNRIVIAYDATKNRDFHELKDIIHSIWIRGDMIEEGDRVTVLGVVHKVLHPMGFQIQIGPESFVGAHNRAIKEEVSRQVDTYASMLQDSARECEGEGVDIEVKIVVGAPIKNVIVQEIVSSNATWAVLDRKLRKELRFFLKHLPCKVATVYDDLSLEFLRPYFLDESLETITHKVLYSQSKIVSVPHHQENETDSVVSLAMIYPISYDISESILISSPTLEHEDKKILQDELISIPEEDISGGNNKPVASGYNNSPQFTQTVKALQSFSEMDHNIKFFKRNFSSASEMDAKRYSYSEIEIATSNFSPDNLLGSGGYGVVYKGRFEDGELVAVKVHKAFAEFHTHLFGLGFARHKHIERLLGYCCKENVSILVYDYVCNKSLEWHLFDNSEVLEWPKRYDIAIGVAKGLHFLHETHHKGPIIHRNIKPSNILLTQDFVPILGDCGLGKWKTSKGDADEKVLGNLGYLAPEYAASRICSEKTDIYALGIVLIQLISGRKTVGSTRDEHENSLRQWAMPLIQTLAFDELVDPRLGYSYNTYELYSMARAARLCVQIEPEMRPTIGEVLRLLEGENDHLRHVKSNLYPAMLSAEAP